MNRISYLGGIKVALLLSSSLVMPSVAMSQSVLMDEVVVVAQKREQNLQNVGVSVAAFNTEQMSALGWSSSEDLAVQIPGLTTSKTAGAAVSQFTVRGVGQADFADHHEPPNAIYTDETYVASPGAAGFPMFDLERVEVLRGPQGTLFGRNATGGLVHFLSNKPSDEFEAYVNLTLAEYSTVRVEGAIGGKITDGVMGRLSLFSTKANGYVKNDNPVGPNLRSEDTQAARAQLLFDVSDTSTLLLNVRYMDVDEDAGIYQHRSSFVDTDGVSKFLPADVDAFGTGPGNDMFGFRDTDGDDLRANPDVTGHIRKEVWGATAKYVHETDAVTLTSITDYLDTKTSYLEDTDSSPLNSFMYDSNQDVSQFSQELRVGGETDNMTWVAGGYYLYINGDYFSSFEVPVATADQNNVWDLKTKSWSLFGQVEYDISDQFKVIGGFRWTDDKKEFNYTPECITVGCPGVFVFSQADLGLGGSPEELVTSNLPAGQIPIALDRHDNDWSGKLEIDWQANDDTLVYASVSRGIKGGGFTAPLDGLLTVGQLAYDPEVLVSYEVGLKMTFLDGMARLNTSAFYYDYNDFQAFEFRGITSVVFNRDASVKGGEVELTMSPAEGLDIMLGAAYLDAMANDIDTPLGVQDQRLINAPEFSANWLIRKSWDVTDAHQLSIQYDGNYTGERYFNAVNNPVVRAASYSLHNARLSYGDNGGKWDISVYVKNIFDKRYTSHIFDISGAGGFTILKVAPPRWAGINVKYYWN